MTYEYCCRSCGWSWEEDQRIVDPSSETCPNCGKKEAYRLVYGGVGFELKGGGWFRQGYSK